MWQPRIIVKKGTDYLLLPLGEVAYFYVEERIVFCVDHQHRKHRTEWLNLQEAFEWLDPRSFFKASRKYIVNLNFIKSYRSVESGKLSIEVALSPSVRISVSQENAANFKAWIRQDNALLTADKPKRM